MLNINPNKIIDGVQGFIDQAGRAISDNDRVAAVNALNDALAGRLITSWRKCRTVPLDRDGRAIKRVAKSLAANSGRLGRDDLLKRYGWMKTKYQCWTYRRTGDLYRFSPLVATTDTHLRYEIFDRANRVLTSLYAINQGVRNGKG
jgi:hypothetical protein